MPIYPMSVKMVDAYGRPVNKRYDINAADYAAALVEAAAFETVLEAVTEARVLSYDVSSRIIITDTATAGANRDEGITFSVRTADNEKAVVKVPCPVNAQLNTDGTVILADTDIAAFLAHYTGGDILVDDGETVTEVISGRLDM